MIQSIKKGRQEDGNRSIADKIIKRLNELEQTIEVNQGRWAWELLQNAKDSISESQNDNISVKIIFNERSVEFIHDGANFTEKDIRGLINQISSKEVLENEKTNKVGRFGTGFLTTHLLSRVVRVRGVLETEDKNYFKFECQIDRRGQTTGELVPKIENTWDEFDTSLEKVESKNKNSIKTSFLYILETERQREIAKIGIREFSNLIPLVLAFNHEIEKISLVDEVKSETLIFFKESNTSNECTFHITKMTDGQEKTIPILILSGERVSIAAQLDQVSHGYVVKSSEGCPKIFCNFPLIGTENFHFPVIINSFYFNPRTERNGIWLKENNEKVLENKELLKEAVRLIDNLVSYASVNNIFELYNLANTRMPSLPEENLDKEWYRENIQKQLRSIILKSKLVETQDKGKIPPSDVYFPDPELSQENRESIWKLSSKLKVNTLPKKEHIHHWAKVVWGDCSIVDIDDVANDLQNKKGIEELMKTLELDEIQTLNWLNDCLKFIFNLSGLSPFNSKRLVPNQKGIFKKLNEISNDLVGDSSLKENALLVGYDVYEKLIHEGILFNDFCIRDISRQEVAIAITKVLGQNDLSSGKYSILAIRKLMLWFEKNPGESKNLFPELFHRKEKLLVDTVEDKESLYKLLTSQIPLSQLAQLSESNANSQEFNNLLEEFGVSDISDLRAKLKAAQLSLSDKAKVELTEEVLLSLGITSSEDLKKALDDNDFKSLFLHTSMPTQEMFFYAKEKIERAKKNVISFLKTLPQYDCSEIDELAPTIIGGIKRKGRPVSIVIRPSDNREVIIYYESEKDALDYSEDDTSVEFWIDNGVDNPKILTLGAILKRTGINRIPV